MNEQTYLEQKNELMGENSFMKKLLKKRLNQKGLTLIELLAVIVILAIIAAIAIPAIGNLIENSRYDAVKADGTNVISAANLYFTERDNETIVTVGELLGLGYLDSSGEIPGTSTTTEVLNDTSATASDDESFVRKTANGTELTTSAITYTGTKTVTFSAASVDEINADTARGSADGNKTIPAPAQTGQGG